MTIQSENDAIAELQAAAGVIQDVLRWYEANQPSPGLKRLHLRAYLLAQDAEALIGAAPDSVANPKPADGTPKP